MLEIPAQTITEMKRGKMFSILVGGFIFLLISISIAWFTPLTRQLKLYLADVLGNNALIISAASRATTLEDEADLRFVAVHKEAEKIESILMRLVKDNPTPRNLLRISKYHHFLGKNDVAVEYLNQAARLIQAGNFDGDFSQPSEVDIDRLIEQWSL